MRQYEVQVRNSLGALVDRDADDDGEGWRLYAMVPFGATEIVVDDLEPGSVWDVRIREVDGVAVGPWKTYSDIDTTEIEGGITPPAPASVSISGGCVAWTMPAEPVDLQGFEVLHNPGNDDRAETALVLHDGVLGHDAPLCGLPGGDRTLIVRAVSADGIVGPATAARVHLRPLDDVADVVVDELDLADASFPGTLYGCSVVPGPLLQQDDAPSEVFYPAGTEPMYLPDDNAPMYGDPDAPAFARYFGGDAPMYHPDGGVLFYAAKKAWLQYVFAYSVKLEHAAPQFRVTVHVEVPGSRGWRLYWRIGNEAPIYSSDPHALFYGEAGDDFYPPQVGNWRPWPGHLDAPPAGVLLFMLVVPGGAVDAAEISVCRVRTSARLRDEVLNGVASSQYGSTRVGTPGTFQRVMFVDARPRVPDVAVNHEDLSAVDGPRLNVIGSSGDVESTTLDVIVRGF